MWGVEGRRGRNCDAKINMQRSGRWIMRTTIVGGALRLWPPSSTLGPGASAFASERAHEKAVGVQRKAEKQAKEDLKAEFVKSSQDGSRLKQTDPDWSFDKGVNPKQDLYSYSLRSGSVRRRYSEGRASWEGRRVRGVQRARRLLSVSPTWQCPRPRSRMRVLGIRCRTGVTLPRDRLKLLSRACNTYLAVEQRSQAGRTLTGTRENWDGLFK